MKKSAFSEEQIAFALKQAEMGTPVAEVIRKLGITEQTFYRGKKKYDGMLPSDLKKLKQLEEENRRLKQMVADLSRDKQMLQDALKKALWPTQKREMVTDFVSTYRVGVRQACRAMQLSRSTFYYDPHRDEQIMLRMKIRDYAESYVQYGYRRIHVLLLREGIVVNHKRVYRLYCEDGLNLARKRPRKQISMPRIEVEHVSRPHHSWAMDFVSDQLYDGRRFRALTVVDIYTRECMAIHPAASISGADVVQVLENLKVLRGKPEYIRVDNGP